MKVAAPAQRVKGKTKSAGLPRPRKAIPHLPTIANSSPSPEQIPNAISELHYYATLLQQLHARHKNQHRGQLWFKQLDLLRRALRDLLITKLQLLDLQQAQHSYQNSAEYVRRRFEMERQLNSRKEELTEWIREVLIPECYVSFSVLVADGDGGFANLGVTLVAAVAGLSGVVGLPTETEEKGMERVEKGVDHEAVRVKHQKQADVRNKVVGGSGQVELEADIELQDDFGTVLDRPKLSDGLQVREDGQTSAKENQQDVEGLIEDAEDKATAQGKKGSYESGAFNTKTEEMKEPDTWMEAASHEEFPAPSKAKLGKKARRKNAIDDLFEGFG